MVNAVLIDVPSWVLSSQLGLHTAKQGLQNLYDYFVTIEKTNKVNFFLCRLYMFLLFPIP
jgi:hypothetical protein